MILYYHWIEVDQTHSCLIGLQPDSLDEEEVGERSGIGCERVGHGRVVQRWLSWALSLEQEEKKEEEEEEEGETGAVCAGEGAHPVSQR